MQVRALRTHRIKYGDHLAVILDQYIQELVDEDIVAITSKILSVIEGRIVAKETINKRSLIYQEAELVLKAEENPYDLYLTVKNGLLIPSAGIDESNVEGVYVLYPGDIQQSATWIWRHLKEKHHLKKVGVLITDSHTTIMRRGVTGVALGWCGFKPLYSYIGKPDIYEHPLKVTQVNILDSLAVASVFVMGEGNEQTPMAIIKEAPHMEFLDRPPLEEEINSISISMEEDLYAPLLKAAKWEKEIF